MTKNEFMTKLSNELLKRNISDAADILDEYEQHFGLKTADGYSEEEIAAKLGNPAELAAQFGSEPKQGAKYSVFPLGCGLLGLICFSAYSLFC